MCRPSRRSVTSPESRSARKCCDTAGCETFEPLTSPVAAISPSRTMRSNSARRVGSARVFITLVSWATVVIAIYKYILIYLSTPPSAGTGRKFAEKARDHGNPLRGTPHDRKAAAAEHVLCRRHGRVAVRYRGDAALAGGVGVPGDLCDTRPRLWTMAPPNRSGTACRANAADGARRAARRRQEIHAGIRRGGVRLVCRDGTGPAYACLRRTIGAAGAGPCDVPALDRLHHVGVPRKFLCRPRGQGAGRAPPSRGLHRPLCLRAPPHVQQHHAILR